MICVLKRHCLLVHSRGGRAALLGAGRLVLAEAQEKASCKWLTSSPVKSCNTLKFTHSWLIIWWFNWLVQFKQTHPLLNIACACLYFADASQCLWGDEIFGDHDCQRPQYGMSPYWMTTECLWLEPFTEESLSHIKHSITLALYHRLVFPRKGQGH